MRKRIRPHVCYLTYVMSNIVAPVNAILFQV
jgi:hypothetical protein